MRARVQSLFSFGSVQHTTDGGGGYSSTRSGSLSHTCVAGIDVERTRRKHLHARTWHLINIPLGSSMPSCAPDLFGVMLTPEQQPLAVTTLLQYTTTTAIVCVGVSHAKHICTTLVAAGKFTLKDKMRVWEKFNRLKRAEEQVDKVKQAAHAMVKYYTQLADRLQAAAPVHMSWLGKHADDADVQAGLRALMAAGGQHVGQQLVQSQQLVARIS